MIMNKNQIAGVVSHSVLVAVITALGAHWLVAVGFYVGRELGQQKTNIKGGTLKFTSWADFKASAKEAVNVIKERAKAVVKFPTVLEWAVPAVVAIAVHYAV